MPPRARESWRPRNNVFITLHPFGSPAAPRAPTPAGRLRARPAEPAFLDFFYLSTQIKTPWLQEGGLPSRRPRPPRGSPGERVGAAGGQARGGGGRNLLGRRPRAGIRAAREATAPQPAAT